MVILSIIFGGSGNRTAPGAIVDNEDKVEKNSRNALIRGTSGEQDIHIGHAAL
jgi:hypothetical protein